MRNRPQTQFAKETRHDSARLRLPGNISHATCYPVCDHLLHTHWTSQQPDLTDNLYFRMRHYFAKQGGELKRCTCEVQYANVYIQNSSGISQTRLRSSLSSESPYLVHAWGFLGPCPSTCPSDTLISCSMKVMSSLRVAAVQSGARRS